MSESPRHTARILVLKAIYAGEHGIEKAKSSLQTFIEEEKLPEPAQRFAFQLLELTEKNLVWANEYIIKLAENWTLERMAAIDRMILQMALVELKFVVDTPEKVVINEAIEIAKEYSTNESSRFINGILDRFLKLSKEESTR